MVQIIVAGAIMLFAAILFIVGRTVQKDIMRFENGKLAGHAQVVGYKSEDNPGRYTLRVKILELNDGKIYTCSQGTVRKKDYPKGKIVDVEYMPSKIMGLNVVQVRLFSPRRRIPTGISKITGAAAALLLFISVIIMIWGLTQIF